MKTQDTLPRHAFVAASVFPHFVRRLLGGIALAAVTMSAIANAKPPARDAASAAPVRFAVLSDLHFYDAKLGTTGTAFENYVAVDPKLLALSEPILQQAIADIKAQQVQFVVITGDLTKDGEVLNHVRVTQYLQKLREAGIGAYVVPGNHDLNNRHAVKYLGDTTRPVPTASVEVFRALYERFGFKQAIDRAPDSLSYVAEPVPGLWLLMLDSVKAAENAESPDPLDSGRLTAATMTWAMEKIQQGQAAGKNVIGFMHHGVNLHFLSEPQLFPGFLIDDWPVVNAQLAGAGLKVIFTGHYHSQDASVCTVNAVGAVVPSSLCDIETASLVSYPCAYRIAEVDNAGILHVTSHRIMQINVDLGGLTFPQYVENFERTTLPYRVIAELEQLFGMSQAQAAVIAPWVVDGLMANYAGDENPDANTQALLAYLLGSPDPLHTLGTLLYTLWYDLPPGDATLDLPLS